MPEGWIRIHRSIENNPYWFSEPFTKAQAWIDLLLLANHSPGHIQKRGILIPLERGQLGHSEDTLAERWKWSRGKVRRFLRELVGRGQISQKTVQQNPHLSVLINIENYDKYQIDGTTDGTTERRQKDDKRYRNKNDNNEKNIYTSDFCSFWSHYPKKVGKAAAWRRWISLNGTRPEISTLLAAIERQSDSEQWKKENGQYIPHPATWLHEARWEDETITGNRGINNSW